MVRAIATAIAVFVFSPTLYGFTVKLDDFVCHNQQEPDNHDEIYFEVTADGVDVSGWGSHCQYYGKNGETTVIDRSISANKSIVINVFEHDTFKRDFLGTITITSSGQGRKQLRGTIDGGRFDYEFHWQ